MISVVICSERSTASFCSLAVLTDASIPKKTLDATLFPGISSSVEVHEGFANEQAKYVSLRRFLNYASSFHHRTATLVLSAVQTAISRFGATHVTMVGHSLGAALSLIDAVYLPLHLPSSISFTTVAYGLPRVRFIDIMAAIST